jgi:hypothetical protein
MALNNITKSNFDVITELIIANQKSGYFYIEFSARGFDVAHREVLQRIIESKNILFSFSNCVSDTCIKPQ